MHYYSFHVSDYIHDTSHLSAIEDLAFRRILDLYYTSEKPIPNKGYEVARRIRLPKNERDVTTVLEEFFELDQDKNCWTHKRCDETIAAYQAKAQRNREVGKLGGRPKVNLDGNHEETQTVSKRNPNQEPITNNHKPIKIATIVATPDGVSDSVWQEFVSHRKSKKAKVTDLVMSNIAEQARLAGWSLEDALKETVVRNWQSFKADWVAPKKLVNKYDVALTTVPSSTVKDPALAKLDEDAKIVAPPSLDTLARLAALRKEISNG